MSTVPGYTLASKADKNKKKRDRKRKKKEEEAAKSASQQLPPTSPSEENKKSVPDTALISGSIQQKSQVGSETPVSKSDTSVVKDVPRAENHVVPKEADPTPPLIKVQASSQPNEVINKENQPERGVISSNAQTTVAHCTKEMEPVKKDTGLPKELSQSQSTTNPSSRIQGSWNSNTPSYGRSGMGGNHEHKGDGSNADFSKSHQQGRFYDTKHSQRYNSDPGHGNQKFSHQTSNNRQYHQNGRGYQPDYHNTSSSYDVYPGDVEFSKEIVRIVRHGAYRQLKVDSEGYISVDAMLSDTKFISICGRRSLEDVKHIVDTNDKKRFELNCVEGSWKIKATQGHTIQVSNLDLKVLDTKEHPIVYHGTYYEAWDDIKTKGLKRMKRNHIHFSIEAPGEKVLSGMRKSCELVIMLDVQKAVKAGMKFFISSNKVVLSEGDKHGRIHPKFFQMAVNIHPYQKIHFEVPEDFKDEPEKFDQRKESAQKYRNSNRQGEQDRYSRNGNQSSRGNFNPSRQGKWRPNNPQRNQERQKEHVKTDQDSQMEKSN